MADVHDVRGPAAALVHLVGMSGTIVGVPVLVARRLAGARTSLVLPAAIVVGAALTVATRRTAWELVKLWIGIDQPERGATGTAAARPLRPPAGSRRRSSRRRGA